MDFIIVWFVLTGGGYTAPLNVQLADMHCGLAGPVVGVQVDKLEDPTIVSWPDPHIADQHCDVDITAKVLSLQIGEYHIATTIVEKLVPIGSAESYIGHDPHVSRSWMRGPGTPSGPPPTDPPPQTVDPVEALRLEVVALVAERDALRLQVAPLTAERDALRIQVATANAKLAELVNALKVILGLLK